MPYIIFPLLDINQQLVFFSFVLVSFAGMISSSMVPKDTVGINLDEVNIMDSNNNMQNIPLVPLGAKYRK